MTEQEYELVDVGRLAEHPRNPNVGDVEGIRESIRNNTWYGVVVAQKSTGYVLAGNHRLRAAIAEGMEQVPTVWKDVSDVTALRILLADNELTRRGGYDQDVLDALLEELGEVGELEGSGFDLSHLEAIEKEREAEEERRRAAESDEENDPLPVPDDEPPAQQYAVLIMCADEDEQRRVFEAAVKKGVGQEVRVLSI